MRLVSTLRLAPATLLLSVGVLLATASAARADIGDEVNCVANPFLPECIVQVTFPGKPGGGGGGGGIDGAGSQECRDPAGTVVPCEIPGRGWLGSDGCYYDGPFDQEPHGQVPPRGTLPGKWYFRSCSAPWGSTGAYWAYLLDQAALTPQQLAVRAVDRLVLPAPVLRTNPGASVPQLAFVPTWIWADPTSWRIQQATATAGGMSITATARPASMTVNAGDGTTITCQGPGAVWTAGTDPAAASAACGHTYTRAGVYTVTATVTWEVTWVGGGTSGTVPSLTTTSNLRLTVTESQALNH
ncbi:hypothetical protein R8Z50_22680 [Longispora sp. K20-0274]|uniref:hypothetical protein n=1 Tax=Longispora sp. K20-0274 TaxID=3088255 RepID=UPI00399A1620